MDPQNRPEDNRPDFVEHDN
jgi:hypothetical protein